MAGDLKWIAQRQEIADGRILFVLQGLVVTRVDRMAERLAVHLVLDEVNEIGQIFVDVLRALNRVTGVRKSFRFKASAALRLIRHQPHP